MKKYLNKILVLIGILLILTTPVSAASKPAYTAVPMANENKTMSFQVYKIDWGKNPEKSWEKMLFGDNLTVIDIKTSDELAQLLYPSLDWGSIMVSSAKESDSNIANEVMSLVSNNMNTLVSFVEKWSANGIDAEGTGELYDELAKLLRGEKATIGGAEFVSTPIPASEAAVVQKIIDSDKGYTGATIDHFRKIKPEGVDNRYRDEAFVYIAIAIPHGYYEGQHYAKDQVQDATYNQSATFVNLSSIATYVANNAKKGLEYEDFYTKTSLENNFNAMFGSLNIGLLNLLQFDDPSKLVFNEGDRAQNYYLGLMPLQWWNVANMLFWGFEIIAIVMLFGSVISMILRQNLATISPTIRNTIKDSIASLIMSIFMLMAYAPIFYVLGKINMMLVTVFSEFATSGISLTGMNDYANGVAWIVKALLFFVNAGLIIKINIDYFTRAVMITVLHVIAPVAIASLAYKQPGSRGVFNSWLKELIGCIFMQSFNALLLAIMFSLLRGSASQWWHTQAALFMLCSLNTWFKGLFGFTDSVNQIAGNVQKQASDASRQAVSNAKTIGGVAFGAASGGMAGFTSGGVGGAISGAMQGAYSGSGGTVRKEGNAGAKAPQKTTLDVDTKGDTNKTKTPPVSGDSSLKTQTPEGDTITKNQTGSGNLDLKTQDPKDDTIIDNQSGSDVSDSKVQTSEGNKSKTDLSSSQVASDSSQGPTKGQIIGNIASSTVYAGGTVKRVATSAFENAIGVRGSNKRPNEEDDTDKFINDFASDVNDLASDITRNLASMKDKNKDTKESKENKEEEIKEKYYKHQQQETV